MQYNNIYIFDGAGVLEVPSEWYNGLKPEAVTDNYSELDEGKYMSLSEEQIDFYLAHPNYDLYHLYHMIPIPVETLNMEIEKTRKGLYTAQSDSLYMSYLKYREFGNQGKADSAYAAWKEKLKEIEEKNPYLTE
jgi:hypothetical protein